MDLAYSTTLIVALIAGVLALLRVLPGPAVLFALVLGTLCLVTSVVVHLLWGHGPETPAPMDFERLVLEHEAFSVAAVILASGYMLNSCAARRSRNRSDA